MKRFVYRLYEFLHAVCPTWEIGKDGANFREITFWVGVISFVLNGALLPLVFTWTQPLQTLASGLIACYMLAVTANICKLTGSFKLSKKDVERIAYHLCLFTPIRLLFEVLVLEVTFFLVRTVWLAIHPAKPFIKLVQTITQDTIKAHRTRKLEAQFALYSFIRQADALVGECFKRGISHLELQALMKDEFARFNLANS